MGTVRKKHERFVRRISRAAKAKGHLEGIPVADDPENIEFAPRTFFREVAEKEFGKEGDGSGALEKPLSDRIPAGSELIRHYETEFVWRGFRRSVWVFRVPTESGTILRSLVRPFMSSRDQIDFLLKTAMDHSSQTISAENKALRKLKRLVSDASYDAYFLTGILYEQGKSGVRYIIRKNRPMLAIRVPDDDDDSIRPRFLCALCLHPLGYHRGSFAGVMCPTDEVIAQLLLIRSDEHFLWRKSNQHQHTDIRSGMGF